MKFKFPVFKVLIFCAVMVLAASWQAQAQGYFIRGDADCNGIVNNADVTYIQSYIFTGGPPPPCMDAADVDDNGAVQVADMNYLVSFLGGIGPAPPPPYPNCGLDPTVDPLGCAVSCCAPLFNHYKTWRVQPLPFSGSAMVKDQFMTDLLAFSQIDFLSNPVKKDTFSIILPNNHLTWYRAHGRDTLLRVEYVNQFESTQVMIDSVEYFLLPTQKQPHDPPVTPDHYKCYRIKNPATFFRPTQLQDQFDVAPEFVDTLRQLYFCTPAQKNTEPVYDTLTHYVAYAFKPQPRTVTPRGTIDQFGIHSMEFLQSEMLLVPTKKKAFTAITQCSDGIDNDGDGLVDFPADCGCASATDNSEAPNPVRACNDGLDNDGDGLIDFPADPGCTDVCDNDESNPLPDTGANHFKTWRIQPLPVTFAPVLVKDQLMKDTLFFFSIDYLSNPCQKIIPGDTFDITDTTEHLNWYRVSGKTVAREVVYKNQFESTSVTIDTVKYLLVPAQKLPHAKPDSLDHYKAYRIKNPQLFPTPGAVILTDQFDLTPEQITNLLPVYFLTPAEKIRVPAEPKFDTLTHYVAYTINPQTPYFLPLLWTTIDQFGQHEMQPLNSEMLLVPTKKICNAVPGDVNGNGGIPNLQDVIYLVNYVFDKDRPATGCKGTDPGTCWPIDPICRGDVNGSGGAFPINLQDVIHLVNFVFDKDRPVTGCLGISPGNCWCPVPTQTCCEPIVNCP